MITFLLRKKKDRVQLTLVGDVSDYFGDASSPIVSLIELKLLFNSMISYSQLGARFMSLGIEDIFLQSILHDVEVCNICLHDTILLHIYMFATSW